jgi:L-serine dehydratase
MADFVGVFSIFKIGIGPSSSHTVGPMRAARLFVDALASAGLVTRTVGLNIRLYGSLSATGRGHGTDTAIILGLAGHRPESIDPDVVPKVLAEVSSSAKISLSGHPVSFVAADDIVFERSRLAQHSNGVRFVAFDADGAPILDETYYSVGGGFVANATGVIVSPAALSALLKPLPHPFDSGDALLERCRATGLSVSTLMLENECAFRSEADVRRDILHLADVMTACVERGCAREGLLPGRLGVKRRAALMRRRLIANGQPSFIGPTSHFAPSQSGDPLAVLDWVSLFALAVNEENAAGGRVVTAPTNGAAGIVPAVMLYYERFLLGGGRPIPREMRDDGIIRFLLTAAAIGSLYQRNASISGAEVGCQGEVGVACSMAAAGLAEVMGGSPAQVENAAEIGMEHNLGLTCDPIGGLVQVPCIERNAMGAIKAINAARLAMSGDGQHQVSLDKVITTMRETGRDMSAKYKETSEGGLAVNITEC